MYASILIALGFFMMGGIFLYSVIAWRRMTPLLLTRLFMCSVLMAWVGMVALLVTIAYYESNRILMRLAALEIGITFIVFIIGFIFLKQALERKSERDLNNWEPGETA